MHKLNASMVELDRHQCERAVMEERLVELMKFVRDMKKATGDLKHGVTCLNTPGLIDSGYRGELKVLLINSDPVEPFEVKRGERIAQLVVQRVEHVVLVPVDDFDHLGESERGEGGFGHTGR